MLDDDVFPRNPDGTLVHKKPCPNGDYPNFHVCLVGKEDRFAEAMKTERRGRGGRPVGYEMDESHRSSISEAMQAKFDAIHALNRERDQKLVNDWNGGDVTKMGLARKYGITIKTVEGALKRFDAEGLLTKPYYTQKTHITA